MNKKLKIAVYGICKNEAQHAERFYQSAKEADMVIMTDTGSTDGLPEKLEKLGVTVHRYQLTFNDWPKESAELAKKLGIGPWRFDTARNISLSYVPEDVDICVPHDMDEVFEPGWREKLQNDWNKDTTRLTYKYNWSHNKDGSPAVMFWSDEIHSRKGYKWKSATHECLFYSGIVKGQALRSNEVLPEVKTPATFTVDHWQDSSKPRPNDLPLLKIAKFEDPENDRVAHYLAREHYFKKEYDEAIEEFKRHISLRTSYWAAERMQSMRYIAKCYAAKKMPKEQLYWLRRACAEEPTMREPWVDLATLAAATNDHLECYYAVSKAFEIRERGATYINEQEPWGSFPHDLAAVSAYHIGLKQKFVEQSVLAYKLCGDDRLKKNVEKFAPEYSCYFDFDAWSVDDHLKSECFDVKLAQAINRNLRFDSILDVGCGIGRYCEFFHNLGIDTTGIEPLDMGSKFPAGPTFVQHNFLTGPYDKAHDLVLCLEVAEHIERCHHKAFFTFLSQVTKKTLIFSGAHVGQGGIGHRAERHESEWRSELIEANFEIDEGMTLELREKAKYDWFKQNILVCKKKQ